MRTPLASGPVRFRGWIARHLGLHFDDTKLAHLHEVLARHARQSGHAPDDYLDRLDGSARSELRGLAGDLTVAETYFFRHVEQFRAFCEVLEAARRPDGTASLRILSAGCASGEEPYSLAMCVQELGSEFARNVAIEAMDVNPDMLGKARRGVYSAWSLRETPEEVQQHWFRRKGRDFEIDPAIREAVWFSEANLAEERAPIWSAAPFDVIFCRNVLMYFTEEAARAAVSRLTRALAPGGYLFLGHAETLRGLSSQFHLMHTHETFYYRRKSEAELAAQGRGGAPDGLEPLSLPGEAARPHASRESGGASGPGATWLEIIGASSARIEALAERRAQKPSGGARRADRASIAAVQVQSALELLRGDRFSEALQILSGLPQGANADTELLLLRAALLTHSGQLAAAEEAGRALLERDELNAGAHYLLALCRESAADTPGAIEHDEAAAHLDPAFAMPRLHLGLMAVRAGDRETARAELSRALPLLQKEDAARLLLFGGGFGREALVALCKARLDADGALS